MRIVLLLPLLLAIVAGAGVGLCKFASWNPHLDAMFASLVISILATLLGAIPLWLVRQSPQSTVAAAGLAATVVQMMSAVLLVALVMKAGLVSDLTPLTYWILALYWMALALLAAAAVRVLKMAPVR